MVLKMNTENDKIRNLLLSIVVLVFFALPQIALAELVNINKANESALQANLSGIGPVKAKAIVEYRKKNGPFKSINELANVPGIGKSLINNNRKNVSTKKGVTRVTNLSTGKNKESELKTLDKKKNLSKQKNSSKTVATEFSDKKSKAEKSNNKSLKAIKKKESQANKKKTKVKDHKNKVSKKGKEAKNKLTKDKSLKVSKSRQKEQR